MIEALVAVVAHVRFLSFLQHSLLWRRDVRDGLAGLRRRKHRILQVGLVVARQRRGVVEALVAVSAGVGLPPGVDLLMLLQVTLADKALPAHVAFVRLFTRVDPLVLPQSCGSRKALCALWTPVGLLSEHDCRVGLLVLLQVGRRGEAFATLAARVGLFARVDLLVLL